MVMDYKKLLFSVFASIWTVGVLVQQIHWIFINSYNITTFIIAIIEMSLPYIIFKMMEDKE